jgi:hypothetical protein
MLSMLKSYANEMGITDNFYQQMVNTEPSRMAMYYWDDYTKLRRIQWLEPSSCFELLVAASPGQLPVSRLPNITPVLAAPRVQHTSLGFAVGSISFLGRDTGGVMLSAGPRWPKLQNPDVWQRCAGSGRSALGLESRLNMCAGSYRSRAHANQQAV